MFIYSADEFGQITVHLMIPDIESDIKIMNDPREDRVLRKVVMRAIGDNVDVVEILNISNLSICPHVDDITKL